MERQPTQYEQANEAREMDPFTNDDFRRISQELLNDDANAHRIIRDAREEIRERYQLLFTKNPEKGEVLELRHLSRIAKSAFSTIIYGDLLHISQDILVSEGSFLPLVTDGDLSHASTYTYQLIVNNKVFTRHYHRQGSAGRHLGAANLFIGRIAQDSIDTLIENPTHPHHNVGRLANTVDWQSFQSRHAHVDNILDREDLFTYWPIATTSDNIKVGLNLMLQLWLSTSRHTGRALTKEEFIPLYLNHIDVLSRASTIKAELHVKLHNTSPAVSFYQQEGMQLPIDEIFPHVPTIFKPTNTPDRYTYVHPSLTDSPWPQARSCPATAELALPDPDKTQAAEDFFSYFTDRFSIEVPRSIYGADEKKGEYSRTNALLLLTLLFAEHTVLDNLPLQPQLFPAIRGTI